MVVYAIRSRKVNRLTELRFYVTPDTKYSYQRRISKMFYLPISWLSTEKLNQTQ